MGGRASDKADPATAASNPVRELAGLDKTIHYPPRLGIMCSLARCCGLGFGSLRRLTGLSQGNLLYHLNVLQDAGYVEVLRATLDDKRLFAASATEAGCAALAEHWRTLERLRCQLRRWKPEEPSKRERASLRELGF